MRDLSRYRRPLPTIFPSGGGVLACPSKNLVAQRASRGDRDVARPRRSAVRWVNMGKTSTPAQAPAYHSSRVI